MEVKESIKNIKDLQKEMEQEMNIAMENKEFLALVKKLKINKEDIKMNIMKLYDSLEELSHCKTCKSLYNCQNKIPGYVYFPSKKEAKLVFSYTECKYKKEALLLEQERETGMSILNKARLKDVIITKNRKDVIKWLKEYFDNYNPYKTNKGLFLHGNFGTGKTYLIAALFNEIKNKYNINYEIVYVPELLRKLKENLDLVGDRVAYLENISLLLLDDIGAEKVTEWGRDEIIGTILQTRVNRGLPTFFTSNLNIQELESILSITKEREDAVKAKRIIERIKFLTDDIELLGNNYREELK